MIIFVRNQNQKNNLLIIVPESLFFHLKKQYKSYLDDAFNVTNWHYASFGTNNSSALANLGIIQRNPTKLTTAIRDK